MAGFLVPALASGLASWEVGVIAFGFVFYILIVGYLLERWEVGLHA